MEAIANMVMSDQGYQQSLIDLLNDKMIFKDVCFDNPVFMAVNLIEVLLANADMVDGASYEGCTSAIYFSSNFIKKATRKRSITVYDVNNIVNAALVVAITNDHDSIYKLINVKRMQNPNYSIENSYKWLYKYIFNATKFSMFYKVYMYNNGDVVVQFT